MKALFKGDAEQVTYWIDGTMFAVLKVRTSLKGEVRCL